MIRKAFRKMGLSQLFSSSDKESQPYPLSSRGRQTLTSRSERDTKKSKTSAAAPSHIQASAWGSDEHILAELGPSSKDITVVSETVIESESWAGQGANVAGQSTTPPNKWGSRVPHR
jgi:hypothetical protein